MGGKPAGDHAIRDVGEIQVVAVLLKAGFVGRDDSSYPVARAARGVAQSFFLACSTHLNALYLRGVFVDAFSRAYGAQLAAFLKVVFYGPSRVVFLCRVFAIALDLLFAGDALVFVVVDQLQLDQLFKVLLLGIRLGHIHDQVLGLRGATSVQSVVGHGLLADDLERHVVR